MLKNIFLLEIKNPRKKDTSELTVKAKYKIYENVSPEESENFMVNFKKNWKINQLNLQRYILLTWI